MIGQFGVTPSSPVMGIVKWCSIAGHKDFLYVITGHGRNEYDPQEFKPDSPSLLCLRKQTGEVVWEDHSPGQSILVGQWSSPTIIEIQGRAQCVAPQGDGWVRSFDALTGKLIWQFDMNRKESIYVSGGRATRRSVLASPVFYDNRIYIVTGQHPESGPAPGRLVCLDPTKSGDISSELAVDAQGNILPQRRIQAVDSTKGEKAIPNPNSGLEWEFTHVGDPKSFENRIHVSVNNVVIHNGLLICADMDGLLHCFDAKTGQRHWRFDLLASCFGSPLIVDDKVYVLDADGEMAIFGLSADPDVAMRKVKGTYEPLRLIELVSNFGLVQCSPIFANGVLYVASSNELFAIADSDEPGLKIGGGSWPQWRGPNRDNISLEKGLLKEWPEAGPPLEWRVDGLGDGIAAPSIANGRIYTLGYFADGEFLTALDQTTARRVWATRLGPKVNESPLMRWLSQRSPTLDDDRVYAFTTNGRLVCLQAQDGRELWSKDYPEAFGAKRPGFGFCDYPLVDGDKLICTPGSANASVVALDKQTGKELWRSVVPGGGGTAYAALVVAEVGGVRQYLAFLSQMLVGLRASDGQVLWTYKRIANGIANTHTPMVRGDQILASNGYGSGLASLKLMPQGDRVDVQEQLFEKAGLDAFQDNSVLVGEHFFGSTGSGRLVCLNAKTLQPAWDTIRLKNPGRVAMIFADERLYVRQSEGQVTLFDVSSKAFVERGSFQIPDFVKSAGATYPVIAGGRFYLRDDNKLLCYDIREEALKSPRTDPRVITLAAPKAGVIPANEPRERTLRSVFVPTPQDVVDKMLEMADVKKTDVVYDLGSGDGRIVISAAKKYGCKAVGYEIDKELVELSRTKAEAAGVKSLVTIEAKDLFTADLRDADVIAVYLLPQQLEKLLPQLEKLKPGVRIVSHYFSLPDTKPDRTLTVKSPEDSNEHTISLWTTPLRKRTLESD